MACFLTRVVEFEEGIVDTGAKERDFEKKSHEDFARDVAIGRRDGLDDKVHNNNMCYVSNRNVHMEELSE